MNADVVIRSPEDLSPPRVSSPIHECAQTVHVTGFLPHAHVEVWSNETDLIGEAKPHFGFSDIALTRALELNERISATQTVDGIRSFHSHEPVVVSEYLDLIGGEPVQPDLPTDLFHCGRVVPVAGLHPGATVFVEESGNSIGKKDAPQDSTSVFTISLNKGKMVVARQVLCSDNPKKQALESEPSDPKEVLPIPVPFKAPEIDGDSNVVGNDSITLKNLYIGARVSVSNQGSKVGGGWANSSINWVPLSSTIANDWKLEATQALCDTDATSDPSEPQTSLVIPTILGPICDSDLYIKIGGSVINATVVILSVTSGQTVGHAGAEPGIAYIPRTVPLIPGDSLQAFQYLPGNSSGLSDPEKICLCSDDWLKRKSAEILDESDPDLFPMACPASTTPLFTNTNPWDVFNLTLSADFSKVNGEAIADDTQTACEVSYIDPVTGIPHVINCEIRARGNSRFMYCGWRPLKLLFDSNPAGTIFDGTGKNIKLVTHCGFKPGEQWILGGTEQQHRCRLIQEFAMYLIQGQINDAALHTRLVSVTYRNSSGENLGTNYAFFREREKRAAQRCGFERLENDEGDPSFPANATSLFQLNFHSKFLFSHDYNASAEHNVIRMRAPDDREHYTPYDFDLSGVIRPDYSKNNNWTIAQNGEHMIDWLSSQDSNLAKAQVVSLLLQEEGIYDQLIGSLVDSVGEHRMRHWLGDHINRLKCFLN